jgi:hypothetical protein
MQGKHEAETSDSCTRGNAEVVAPSEPWAADNALLALERQFEDLAREFATLSRTDAIQHGHGKRHDVDARSATAGSSSKFSSDVTRAGDGPDRASAERLELLEAALAQLEPIERAIMATPAQTVIGLGVKARHAAYVISEYWAEPLEKADWDRRAVRLLIEAVCVLAGRPLPNG